MRIKRLKRWLRARTGSPARKTGVKKNPRRNARLKVLRMMPEGSVCAEIGVWKGAFSTKILNEVQPTLLHLIDPWEFIQEEGYEHAMYGGKVAGGQAEMDGLFDSVQQKFAKEITGGMVRLHRDTSAEAGASFPDDYFDWVYIDGNHSYDFVRQDLLIYHAKVKPGGYIAGDDYGTRGWWRGGVKKAVDEFVASGKAQWALQDGSQFVLRKG